jgi:glucose/arabinose dehydrogenase
LRALALVALSLTLVGAASPAAELRVPRAFRVTVVARGLTHPTTLARGPGGRLYATEDVGRLLVIRGGRPRVLATGLATPLGLVFHRGAAYVSETGKLERLRVASGRVVSRRTIVSGLPYGLHQQDNVVVARDGRLYFGSGSTCDACGEGDPRSAAVLSVRPNGTGLRVVAHGLRNPYGLVVRPRSGQIYASVNGQDKLGTGEPAELVVRVRWGASYGWPRCWPSFARRRLQGACAGVAKPAAYLEPHSSADGIAFWHGALYVAEWGQYSSSRAGRRVVRIELGRNGAARRVTTFADGFDHPLALLGERRGLLVADWGRGVVYRIARR